MAAAKVSALSAVLLAVAHVSSAGSETAHPHSAVGDLCGARSDVTKLDDFRRTVSAVHRDEKNTCTAADGKVPKFHIVTQVSSEILDYGRITAAINAAYAANHGYTFEAVEQLTLDTERMDHRYEKVNILREKLDEICPAMKSSKYKKRKQGASATSLGCPEWLVWVDADAAVVDFKRGLDEFVDDADEHIHFHACRDTATDIQQAMNSGIMFLRNNGWTRDFLDAWWRVGNGAVSNDDGSKLKITDEEAFQFLFKENLVDIQRHTSIHKPYDFNTAYPYFTLPDEEKDDLFIFHPLVSVPYVRTKIFQYILDGMCSTPPDSKSSPSLGAVKQQGAPRVPLSGDLLTNLTATWMKEWAEKELRFDGTDLGLGEPWAEVFAENNHLAHVAATNAKNIGTRLSQMWINEYAKRDPAGVATFDFSPDQKKMLRYFQSLALRIGRSNWSDPKMPGACSSCSSVCADSSKVLGELYESFTEDAREVPAQIKKAAVDDYAANLATALALYRTALECQPDNYGAARRFTRVYDQLSSMGLDSEGKALQDEPPLDLMYIKSMAAATAADAAAAAARDAIQEMMQQSFGGMPAMAGEMGAPNPKFHRHDDRSW